MKTSRTIVLIWIALWMLALPLIHVHPDSDHRHGERDHVHGGTTHTVFSNDLPCEYATHYGGALSLITHASHAPDHPEIGFLLASSADRPDEKPTLSALYHEAPRDLFFFGSSSAPISIDAPQFFLLSPCLSSRAPPDRST